MRKALMGLTILLLLVSLTGCDNENSETISEVPQEQFDISGARIQITDATLQQEVLALLEFAEQESMSRSEAQDILTSPQNSSAKTIEFRIEGMWYSFHETGVLTVHEVGKLAEYFYISDAETITEIFLEYAK